MSGQNEYSLYHISKVVYQPSGFINQCDCHLTTTKQQEDKRPFTHSNTRSKARIEGSNTPKRLIIFSDGGARGNPGPAATAFLILTEKTQVLTKNSSYIGTCTNNQAEYYALISALETAVTLKPDEVICHTDSELVAKQLKGEFIVKNPTLKQLWQRVKELEKQFKKVSYVNVPRTHSQIQEADRLVNLTLDKENKTFNRA